MRNRIYPAAILTALALALAACGSASPPTNDTIVGVVTTSPPGDTTTAVAEETLPPLTFSTYPGYNATILQQATAAIPFADCAELCSAGEVVRDEAVEACLALELTHEIVEDMPAEVTRRMQAGESPDLLVFADATDAAALAPGGYLADLSALPTLRLDHPAFDAALIRELSLSGHTYFLFGDATVGDKAATSVLLLNTAAADAAALEIGPLLDLVHTGDWTVEALLQYAASGGMSLDAGAAVPIFFGSGGKIFDRDTSGTPVIQTGDAFSQAYAAAQQVMAASQVSDAPIFTDGKLDELGEGLIALPYPTAELGAPYRSAIDPTHAECISIPADPADPTRTGELLTAYFTESTETVADPLRAQLIAHTDAETLDCILAARTCALGTLFGWGDLAAALIESISLPEKEFLDSVAMRITTAARAMEIFLSRLG